MENYREELLQKYKRLSRAAHRYSYIISAYNSSKLGLEEETKKYEELKRKYPWYLWCLRVYGIFVGANFGFIPAYLIASIEIPIGIIGSCLGLIGMLIGSKLGFSVATIISDKTKARKQILENAEKYKMKVIDPLKQRLTAISDEINKAVGEPEFSELEGLPSFLHSEDALNFCVEALETNRASTEKELYSLYKEHLDKQEILRLNRQLVEGLQELLEKPMIIIREEDD